MDWILVIIVTWGKGKGAMTTVERSGPFPSEEICAGYLEKDWWPRAMALFLRERTRGIHLDFLAQCMSTDQAAKWSWPIGNYPERKESWK